MTESERWFRASKAQSLPIRILRTVLQVVFMWGMFLVLLPYVFVLLQDGLGVTRFDVGEAKWALVAAFAIAGAAGLYSGWLFVTHGKGTPFPLDQTTELVVLGPYRWVRNPMALLGIVQGVLVGLFVGSWFVIAYALIGAFAWNLIARPHEERDLQNRHGELYGQYFRSVRCWIPMLKPYRRIVPKSESEESS